MKNSSFVIFLLLLALTPMAVLGQKKDAIHLKDGSIIRGSVLDSSGSTIRIKTSDASEWVFQKADINKTTQENAAKSYRVWNKHFYSITQLGFLAGNNSYNGPGFSANFINGYRFNPYLAVGGMVGLDVVSGDLLLPMAADVRGLVVKANVSPYYFGQLGYAAPQMEESNTITYQGGLMYHLGFGMQFRMSEGAGFLFEMGYKTLSYSYDMETPWRQTHEDIQRRKISIRIGVIF